MPPLMLPFQRIQLRYTPCLSISSARRGGRRGRRGDDCALRLGPLSRGGGLCGSTKNDPPSWLVLGLVVDSFFSATLSPFAIPTIGVFLARGIYTEDQRVDHSVCVACWTRRTGPSPLFVSCGYLLVVRAIHPDSMTTTGNF